jgi:antitoxin-like ribbon-helix-helix protein
MQCIDGGDKCLTKRRMGRAPKPGAIRPIHRQGKKSVTVYLPIAVWRQLRITAAVHDRTLDALLQRGALLVLEEFKKKPAP